MVGSSQEQGTENNPWSYEQRERMVQDVVKDNGLQDVVVKIVGVPDNPSDVAWLANVREIVPEFDVVISNNEWVLSIFREAGVETIESGLYNRDELEGVKIRGLIKANNRSWVSRVPKVIYKLIEEYTSK